MHDVNSLTEECCSGLQQYSYKCIHKAGKTNGLVICNYLLAMRATSNLCRFFEQLWDGHHASFFL
jgi:hypothetical protein